MIELKTLRKSTHLTQMEFADVLKVPVSTYSKWEQGINNPAESQVFLMCYYLYNKGYIKTYLNDSRLSLTEMGIMMNWLRYDGHQRFSANSKNDICFFIGQLVPEEETKLFYKKLYKRYILPRKLPKVENIEGTLSDEEQEKAAFRILDGKGIEILPFDGGAIRGTSFAGDTYFFFERLAGILGMEKNMIERLLWDECHSDFYINNHLSLKAQAVMNCLYYRYALNFPLCFGVKELIEHYGDDFFSSIEELKDKGYISVLDSGYYEFNTEDKDYKHGTRYYINGKWFLDTQK
jgi:transcriptional regulator with XRE-family HTH domain